MTMTMTFILILFLSKSMCTSAYLNKVLV